MIFFSDFDIKRLIKSEHLLIDGTFVKPIGFLQTIIIMYYDIIIDKMIPGIYIIINNKTYEGYYDSFLFIKNFIDKINGNNNYNFLTFTTDYEVALFTAFNKVFNSNNKVKHVGCYFHFLNNIHKYLQKNGFTTNKYKKLYDSVINLCKNLPFLHLKGNILKNHIKKELNSYKNELSKSLKKI